MAFSDPQSILNEFGLHAGQVVADLGAGTGGYSLLAAKMITSAGKVYAVEVQPDLLVRLKNDASHAGLDNIEIIHGDMEQPGGTRIKDKTADIALVCNALFQIEHKEQFIQEIKRILKSTGRVLVVDWTESFGGLGPQPEYVITEAQTKQLFEKNGFQSAMSIQAGD
jgi:ubiquinone/menaquinone biosynthesis C-methylase UbiE